MKTAVLLWLLCSNIVAFVFMGVDKSRAKRGKWRIPEKVLFLSAILGGSIGALLGMGFFRHKTKHWRFVLGIPVILLLQVAVALGISWWEMFGRWA